MNEVLISSCLHITVLVIIFFKWGWGAITKAKNEKSSNEKRSGGNPILGWFYNPIAQQTTASCQCLILATTITTLLEYNGNVVNVNTLPTETFQKLTYKYIFIIIIRVE